MQLKTETVSESESESEKPSLRRSNEIKQKFPEISLLNMNDNVQENNSNMDDTPEFDNQVSNTFKI